MLGFAGAASGSALYLVSNMATVGEDVKAGLYLGGMTILAVTLTGALQAGVPRFKTAFASFGYLARTKLQNLSDSPLRARG